MSAHEEQVKGFVAPSHFSEAQPGEASEASKLNIAEIQENFGSFLDNPKSIEMLGRMNKQQQKDFVITLIATATEPQIVAIATANSQVHGGNVNVDFRNLLTVGLAARRDFLFMGVGEADERVTIADYLINGKDINGDKFNHVNHDMFRGLATMMRPEERQNWLYQLIIEIRNDAEKDQLAVLFNQRGHFGAVIAKEFNELMCLLRDQDFVSAANPAEILAHEHFNSAVYNAYPGIFDRHIAGKSGAIEEKFDVSQMDDIAKTRVYRHLDQMNNDFSRPLMALFQLQADQAQQDDTAASAASSSETAAKPSQAELIEAVGFQQEMRRRNVGKKSDHKEDKTDIKDDKEVNHGHPVVDQNAGAACFGCSVL